MKVAIALFPRNTSLDAIGPDEVLQRIPSIDVVFVGHRRGEVRSDNGMLGLTCDAAFDEVTEPDVLIFPGGLTERVVEHLPERIITAAGVSSGIDMGLRLAELLVSREAAQASQLMIEYDPEPPFDSGDLAKASDATRRLALEFYQRRA
jgi:DJ-1/PfpI family protein